jgi:TonB-linked SusC/RagA family outer membrane protein
MYKIYTKKLRDMLLQPGKTLFHNRIVTTCAILVLLVASTSAMAQKVSLSANSATLKSVLKNLHKQSKFDFLYTDVLLQHAKPVTVNVSEIELKDALNLIFQNQPLTYTIDERTVVIKERQAQRSTEQGATSAKPMLVTGMVTDNNGIPLEGASVIVKRTQTGTNTDRRGIYVATNARQGDTLLVSYIGYKSGIAYIGNDPVLNIKLYETTNSLDEVVVEAYGTTTQRLTTSNISRVTAADIEKQPVYNPLLALEGRIPGLEITPTSGYQSGPVFVELRGRNSINPNFTSDPLYVIDGVPQAQIDLHPKQIAIGGYQAPVSKGLDQTGMSPAGGQSPLASINPTDIASIEVLKDADATAIYGSRGANGVILITTKKGKAGADVLNVTASQGVQFVPRFWDLLNTPQYLTMRREAFANDKLTPTTANAADLLLADTNSYINWQKQAYGGTAQWTNAQLSYSGGNDQTTFRISGGYNRSTSLNNYSGMDQRASVATAFTEHSKDRRFNLQFTTEYSYSQTDQVVLTSSITAPPDYPALFTPKGQVNFAGYDRLSTADPGAGVNNPYLAKTNYLNTNLALNYNIIKGLTARVNLGYNFNFTDQSNISYIASIDPAANVPHTGSANYGTDHGQNWLIEPQLEYSRQISKGALNVLFGATDQSSSTREQVISSSGYSSDELIHSLVNATTFTATDGYGQYKYDGLFARITYNWDDKYVLNLNGRRDGSSRFGPDNRYGNFGSVGAAWIANQEKWLKDALPEEISFVKFRGSYGITGSDAVGDYAYLSQLGNVSPVLTSYNGVSPITTQIIENPNFHWQVNKKLEGALDLGFLHDRINVEAAYYRDRVGNQLVQFPIPEITGFTSVVENSPAVVQNSGWEFQANAQILKGAFTWNMNFNISFNNNKLLAYPDIQFSPYYSTLKIGKSLNDVYAFNYTGVDPKTGQYTYTDSNGDGKIQEVNGVPEGTDGDDRYVVINLKPKYMGGFNEQFGYKGLSLSAYFTYRKQVGKTSFTNTAGTANNISVYQFQNTWTTPGQAAQFARFTTTPQDSDYDFSASTGVFTDASYIRLQTLALSYLLPSKWISHLGMSGFSINANAQNLFVLTHYKGLDPEIQNFPALPSPCTITLGLSGNF